MLAGTAKPSVSKIVYQELSGDKDKNAVRGWLHIRYIVLVLDLLERQILQVPYKLAYTVPDVHLLMSRS